MGKQLNIKLDIAGKPYEMAINAENEEVYRLAAREINNRLATAQQSRVDGFGVQDYLAIIAVDLMISNIRLERKNSVEDGDLKTLTELAERLSKHLEK
jgi:cell division protein ZapA